MRKTGLFFGLVLLLVGCVAVNVYVTFPQEKLDKAMEGLELQVQPGVSSPTVPKEQSRFSPGRLLEPAPLYAETITSEVRTTSSIIEEAKARRIERLSDIQGYKDKKVLGENNEGLLEVRSTEGLDGKQTSLLQKMVKEENNDRTIIYREIVRVNNMPSTQLKNVQAAAAKANRKLAKEGEWIQDEKGAWKEKEAETKK